MDSHTLTVEQATKLKGQIAPTVRYLNALVRRMERMAFPSDDDLYQKAVKARDEVQALWMAEHYLSVPGGVAAPPGYYRNRKVGGPRPAARAGPPRP